MIASQIYYVAQFDYNKLEIIFSIPFESIYAFSFSMKNNDEIIEQFVKFSENKMLDSK